MKNKNGGNLVSIYHFDPLHPGSSIAGQLAKSERRASSNS
jgi:hypothetical protein